MAFIFLMKAKYIIQWTLIITGVVLLTITKIITIWITLVKLNNSMTIAIFYVNLMIIRRDILFDANLECLIIIILTFLWVSFHKLNNNLTWHASFSNKNEKLSNTGRLFTLSRFKLLVYYSPKYANFKYVSAYWGICGYFGLFTLKYTSSNVAWNEMYNRDISRNFCDVRKCRKKLNIRELVFTN